MHIFDRTEKIIGADAVRQLAGARVMLFGVGGVGSYAGEALARGGIGHLTLVDQDKVDPTNINRQLIALQSTVGKAKVEVAANRYRDINPDLQVNSLEVRAMPENMADFHLEAYDYVLDAVDTVTAKLAILSACSHSDTPVISCMGTGNKLDPARLEIAPIEKTAVCPLARVMRRELKARGIAGIPVVYSREEPRIKVSPPGSVSFVPGAAGLMMAGYAISKMIEKR
ncbi:MAG: tRNA threonylcarbamoyladenosine dehydratase [Bacilli bacterium]|nr:tRNA threonylcarbamoyladenosine dehydratase [Bacilli bacterium]